MHSSVITSSIDDDNKKTFEWYHQLALHNIAAAQYLLGICYAKGEGTEQNQEKAFAWFKKAAHQGYSHAENKLGIWVAMHGKFDEAFCLQACNNDINQLYDYGGDRVNLLMIAILTNNKDLINAVIENRPTYDKNALISIEKRISIFACCSTSSVLSSTKSSSTFACFWGAYH